MNLTALQPKPIFPSVPNFKPAGAEIALVGEAGGREEARLKMPMVGDTGYNIRKFATAGSVQFERCARLNVFPVHPPDNEIGHCVDMGKRPKLMPGFEDAVEFLHQELASLPNLRVIVAMGNVALWALTGLQEISKWRGSPLWSERLKCHVIPTIHPSPKTANRDWYVRYLIMSDFGKVARFAANPGVKPIERNLIINPSFKEAMDFFDYCENEFNTVAFDIETYRRATDCFSLAPSPTLSMSIPIFRASDSCYLPPEETTLMSRLSSFLYNAKVRKVLQNAIFDFGELYKSHGMVIHGIHDTLIMHRILYPELPKDLGTLTSMYTDQPYYKDDLKIAYNISDYDMRYRYNALDSAVTIEIAQCLLTELKQKGMTRQYERQLYLIEPFIIPTKIGMKVDEEHIRKLGSQLEMEHLEKVVEFQTLANKNINPASGKQLKEFFKNDLKVDLPKKRTQKGGETKESETLDKQTLFQFATKEKTAAYANIIIDMRAKKKALDYYRVNTVDGRLTAKMNPAGTETGRPSSGKDDYGEGGNILNLTSEYKKVIKPDEGFFFVEVDYSQAEARVVSIIAPEPTMLATFRSGVDIHKKTASLIFQKPIDQIDKKERQIGKTANHSLNYQLGPISFARRNRLPLTFATYVHKRYFQVYPGLTQFHEWIKYEVHKNGILTNVMGSKRWFLGRPGDDLTREGCAYIPQSTVADCIHEFGLPFLYEEFPEAIFMNDVYDALWFQVSIKADKHTIAQRLLDLKKSMERTLSWRGEEFNIPVDFKIGWNAGEKVDLAVTDDIGTTANLISDFLSPLHEKTC